MANNSDLYASNKDEEEIQSIEELSIDYFRERDIDDVRKMLGDLLYVALTRNSEEFDDGLKRDDAIFFCRQTDALLTSIDRHVQERKPDYTHLQS